ncbi:TniQ family protein [Streptomyces sp. NPDC048272]|uniref:TniQ family protein n=1 Tax=Streptomyces sp. NPDC048272 TaxID=3154616 RepID=UPI0034453D00
MGKLSEPRTLSIRVAPLPDESMDSWLETLARRCSMSLPALISAFGLPRIDRTHRLVTGLTEHHLRQVEHRLALPPGRLEQAVVPGDLFGQRAPRCRFCPECLTETQGRWNLRWWLPWALACSRHQALLHIVCPRCGTPPRQRVPGQVHLHRPARCLNRAARKSRVCGADLGFAPSLTLFAYHSLIGVQQRLDAIPVHGHQDPGGVFARVDALLTPVEHGRAGQLDRMSPAALSTWERTFDDINDPASQFCGWRMRERARTVLTRGFLDREYDENKKSLSQLAVDFGLPYRIVIERAKELGFTVTAGSRPLTFDDRWLREQYVTHLRSTRDIGKGIGISEGPVKRRLAELGVALRPVGPYSRKEMIARLDESVPGDIRAAVEGTTHGWLRLRRFQIHMALPSLAATSAYLGVAGNSLTRQFKQLEAAIGAELVHRAARHAPQRPTLRGTSLLRQLDEPQARELMQHALGPDITPMPSTSVQAHAAAAFNGKNAPLTRLGPATDLPAHIHVPPPLLPLLRHLFADAAPETYVMQIHALTGIRAATLYGQLHRLVAAGWLQRRRESANERMQRGGGGHLHNLYTLSPAARLVPIRDVLNSPLGPSAMLAG